MLPGLPFLLVLSKNQILTFLIFSMTLCILLISVLYYFIPSPFIRDIYFETTLGLQKIAKTAERSCIPFTELF